MSHETSHRRARRHLGERFGFSIKYQDGYQSWCPENVYYRDYQPSDALSFGHALYALKQGERVARGGWNGKGMFVYLVPGSRFMVNREPLLSILGEGAEVNYNPHLDLKTADGTVSTWVPSINDVLANDWVILPKTEV